MAKSDWRIENARFLKQGLQFQRKPYKPRSETWTHDHCAGCWATLAEYDGPNFQHEGYATCEDYEHGADYDWLCVSCFSDLREEMGWVDATPPVGSP
jgi:hypothetical protein